MGKVLCVFATLILLHPITTRASQAYPMKLNSASISSTPGMAKVSSIDYQTGTIEFNIEGKTFVSTTAPSNLEGIRIGDEFQVQGNVNNFFIIIIIIVILILIPKDAH